MRHRKIAFMSGAVLAVALAGACTGGGQAKDCGTIDMANPMATARDVAACWQHGGVGNLGYHLDHNTVRKFVVIDGTTTTTYQTVQGKHQIVITTDRNGTVSTRTCGSNQVLNSQVFIDEATGRVTVAAC